MPLLDVGRRGSAPASSRLKPKRRLGQVVGAEREELGLLGDLAGRQRGARQLDHRADQVVDRAALLGEDRRRRPRSTSVREDRRAPSRCATSGIMISGRTGSPPLALTSHGGLEDRADLHLVDLGEGDRRAGSRGGRASGWTRAARSARRLSFATATPAGRGDLGELGLVVRQELVQRRVEQADGAPAGRPSPEDPDEVGALVGQQLGERARGGPPRRRRGSSRARRRCARRRRTCARCGTGRCPRRRTRAPCGVGGGVGVGADLHAAVACRPTPSACRSRRPARARSVGTSPSMTSPVVPSIVMKSPSLDARGRRSRSCARRRRSQTADAPETQGLPMPRATTAAWLVMPPRAVRMPLRGVHAVDVLGAGLDADEDHLLAARAPRSRRRRRRARSCPQAAPGRGRQALGEHVALARRGRASGGAAGRAPSGSTRRIAVASSIRPSPTISTAIRSAAVAVRLPVRVWSMHSLPCCDGELDVLHVAVVPLEQLEHARELGVRPRASPLPSTAPWPRPPRARPWSGTAGCGCRRRRPRPGR